MIRLHYKVLDNKCLTEDQRDVESPVYFQVTEYPESESTSCDPRHIACDLVTSTSSDTWTAKDRRRIGPGDLFTAGTRVFRYTSPSDANRQAMVLQYWKHLVIVELAGKSLEEAREGMRYGM